MNRLSRVVLGAVVVSCPVLALGVGASSTAEAQIPESFSNLQVLPADTSRAVLVGVMRNYASSLGVGCDHCHVGDDVATFEDFDFASDDKEAKQVARSMMRMVEVINGDLLPASGRDAATLLEVGCATCHHGVSRPEPLRAILMTAFEEGGVDAVIVRYQELREQYYGRASYDFGRATLSSVAELVARAHRDFEATERLLVYNIGLYPDWDYHYFLVGVLRSQLGNMEGAREALEKAVELDPDSSRNRDALARIRRQ
ncbi:MAG: c-type cytochrome [Acidobacteria bacterium]|nr:c-type cytochrome [Acidobacteriota bacterium]